MIGSLIRMVIERHQEFIEWALLYLSIQFIMISFLCMVLSRKIKRSSKYKTFLSKQSPTSTSIRAIPECLAPGETRGS